MDDKQLTKMFNRFRSAFDRETIENLARSTDFTKRIRVIEPHQFVISAVTAMATQQTETIADIVRTFNAIADEPVEYKPFHNQLAKAAFPEMMRLLVCHLLHEFALKVLTPATTSKLRMFKDIEIQDGSSFALHPALRDVFPGRFTTISPAAVELHATMSLFSDQVTAISIAPDSEGERHFLPAPSDLAGRLILADRGYEDLAYCRAVAAASGYFIIRCKSQLNPLITRCEIGGKRIKRFEGKRLNEVRTTLRGKTADITGEWTRRDEDGKHVVRFRVALIWNPQKRQHMILLTNLARAEFTAKQLYLLYRLRWQIELVFKEWKSYANLQKFVTRKAAIAEGLMWASLAAALLKRFIAHATQHVFEGIEISTRRTAMAANHVLRDLMVAVATGVTVRAAFKRLVTYIGREGRRAHPDRDRKTGRLQLGLRPRFAN